VKRHGRWFDIEEPFEVDFAFSHDVVARHHQQSVAPFDLRYCAETIRGPAAVDHFLPWARHPDKGIENLVLADASCNGHKRHFLAGALHVQKRAVRIARQASELVTIANQCAWESHSDRTLSVARAVYLRLPDHAMLWRRGDEFVAVDRQTLAEALG